MRRLSPGNSHGPLRHAMHFARDPDRGHGALYWRLLHGMRLAHSQRERHTASPTRPEASMRQNTQLLKDIVSVAQDGADFYHQAQSRVEDPGLRKVFSRMAGAKRELISGLSGHLRNLGAEPPRGGTALGTLRETYARLRASLGHDDAGIYTDQLEQTEDRLLEQMRQAIRAADPPVRSQLEMYMPEVQACHDEMRSLKQRAGSPAVH